MAAHRRARLSDAGGLLHDAGRHAGAAPPSHLALANCRGSVSWFLHTKILADKFSGAWAQAVARERREKVRSCRLLAHHHRRQPCHTKVEELGEGGLHRHRHGDFAVRVVPFQCEIVHGKVVDAVKQAA